MPPETPQQLSGVLPIAHTPFLNDDRIDEASLQRQVEWAYEVGADGCCTGMVSELLRLTSAERVQLTKLLADLNRGRGWFVASVGAESTRQAVEYCRSATEAGADAVMAIPPLSTALSDSQLTGYFAALASETDVPLIVQDASSYVGQPISHTICRQLLERFGADRIFFKPEASPLGPNLSALRDATDGQARIFEGSGGISLIDSFRRGVAGTMPGMEFLPGIIAIWRALQQGDEETAYRVYFPICALVALQLQAGLDGFLAIEKYVLHQRGLFANPRRRRPYHWELDEETRQEVDRLLQRLEAALQE